MSSGRDGGILILPFCSATGPGEELELLSIKGPVFLCLGELPGSAEGRAGWNAGQMAMLGGGLKEQVAKSILQGRALWERVGR